MDFDEVADLIESPLKTPASTHFAIEVDVNALCAGLKLMKNHYHFA